MPKVAIPTKEQAEFFNISPEYVRLSMAAAMQLGLKPGRMYRDAMCGCINLLQNYPEGCWANCTYCGLARERPGTPEDNTFIRVAWPLFPTAAVAEKIAEHASSIGRVCVAQVQDHRANDDLITITRRVRRDSDVPISALVSATLMNTDVLHGIKEAGADIIGVGLDAASEDVFVNTRGKGANSPHDWDYHWDIVRQARDIYGPMKVNCHIVVGLGETDKDLVNLFYNLKAEQIAGYLFSFNPEPGTGMENQPRAPIHRTRQIQLVKYLIEERDLSREAIEFDAAGSIAALNAPEEEVNNVLLSGLPFMTNGCPDETGAVACNRPYGSYRPGEEFRDYPFQPQTSDLIQIQDQINLDDILR